MCWPEHMWRIGPGFSPSRARRAAVSVSSGMPSVPQARRVWLMPARRNSAWRVRTWRSSPECELAMIASLAGRGRTPRSPPASMSATSAERLDRRAERDEPVGVAERRMSRPAASASTMSPRWTLSSMPLRIWRDEDRRRTWRGRARVGARASGRGRGRCWHGSGWPRHVGPRGYRGRGSAPLHDEGRRPARRSAPGGRPSDRPEPPRLAAPGRPPQARDPARRGDRAEEVPRGRARAVVAARVRGARRRARPAARDPDADRAETAHELGERIGLVPILRAGLGWSTRCSS